MASVGDLYMDLTCTPNGNRLFVVTEMDTARRFGKPDELLTGRLYNYNDAGDAVFFEESTRWLSSMKAHVGRVKDINLVTITKDDVE